MQRRQLLSLLAAAPLVQGGRRFDLSRISLLTDEIAQSPEEAIAFCKKYGIRNVELRSVPGAKSKHYGRIPEPEIREAAKQFRDNGLRVTFLNTGFFKITLPGTEPVLRKPETQEARQTRLARHKADFDGRKEELRKAIENAHILGVDKLRVFTFLRVAEPRSTFQQAAEVIAEMADIAAKDKIQLLVENEGACNVVTCAEVAEFLKLLPQKNVGFNWDPLNGTAQKENPFPDGYALLPKKRIWNVQLKGHSLLDEQRKLDWRAIFAALDKDGYKGFAGLETHYFDGTLIEKSNLSVKEIIRLLET